MESRRTKTISVRLPLWLSRIIEKEADKLHDGQISEPARQRLKLGYKHLLEDEDNDLNLTETQRKLVENSEEHIEAHSKLEFIERENQKGKAKMREITFPEYIDSKLARIHISNLREENTVEQSEKEMKQWLETMRERAEYHGKLDEFENRVESPIDYANQYLGEKMKRNKLKGDDLNLFKD